MSDTEDPNIEELKAVTALEAFCLASAIASIISGGDAEISKSIVLLADSIHKSIVGTSDDSD